MEHGAFQATDATRPPEPRTSIWIEYGPNRPGLDGPGAGWTELGADRTAWTGPAGRLEHRVHQGPRARTPGLGMQVR